MIAPASGEDNFCIDMATTTVALGKVEVNRRKGTDIPTGWAVDRNGASTNDAEECFVHGGLLPLGGLEENGGYKGFGLGLMVEILCGGLSGSKVGFYVDSRPRSKLSFFTVKAFENHKSMQITFVVGVLPKTVQIQQILVNVSWQLIQIALLPDSLIVWMI